MAEVERKRTLVNPARRRKRNPKRKMSAKQIRHFGTKRQKAALKASRKRRNAGPRSVRKTKKYFKSGKGAGLRKHLKRPLGEMVRTFRKKKRRNASHRRRSNPGGIVEVALNPAAPKRKRRSSVAKRRRKATSRRRTTRSHRRRTNPVGVARTHRRRRSTGRRRSTRRRSARRNPSMGGVSNLLVSAAYAIGGAVGSKYLTQMVLGASNTGYVGYAANLAAAFVTGKAVGMFTHNKSAENSVILGGVIMTLVRFLSDQTPLGTALQNAGLGDYEASTWLSPARYVNAAASAQVDIPNALRPQLVAKGGMSGLRGSGTYSRGRGTY